MASIRTARVLAAVAALPLAAALFTGVAAADNGGLRERRIERGRGDRQRQRGRRRQQRQLVHHAAAGASGSGASNQNNTAQVNGSAFTAIDQTQREHRGELHQALVSRPAPTWAGRGAVAGWR